MKARDSEAGLFSLLFAAAIIAGAPALAATDASSNLKIEDVKNPGNQPKGDDVDTMITNPKLRAETGSKSKYSISTSFGYSGGSLKQPFGERRPNITGALGYTGFPTATGSFSGKYAFTTQSSLLAGSGLRWVAPLEGTRTPKGYNGDRVDVDNPWLIYQYLYNMKGLQSSLTAKEVFITASDIRAKGYVTNWALAQSSVYEFGTSGFALGFNTYVGIAYYDKDQFASEQGLYSWNFSPLAEYHISDRWNLHLDTGLFAFEHVRATRDPWTFKRYDVTQNLSLGYVVKRDIYVSPSVSFSVNNLSLERTTWGLGANINLF